MVYSGARRLPLRRRQYTGWVCDVYSLFIGLSACFSLYTSYTPVAVRGHTFAEGAAWT